MTNYLKNGDFEGEAGRKCFDGGTYSNMVVPEGWTCFWDKNGAGENLQANAKPETKVISRVAPYLEPLRIAEGNQAFQLFTFMKPHVAGIYQLATGLTAGKRYRVTASYHAWCSQGDDPAVSDQKTSYGMFGMIGVDQQGRVNKYGYVDPAYDNYTWFDWSEQFYVFDQYEEINFEFEATGTTATIALLSCSKWGSKHGDAYWDAVRLEAVDEDAEEDPPEDEDPAADGPDEDVTTLIAAVTYAGDQLKRIADYLEK